MRHSTQEEFTGSVIDLGPGDEFGHIMTDAGDTLFCHKSYTCMRKMPTVGTRVSGRIARRVGEPSKQDRAVNVREDKR